MSNNNYYKNLFFLILLGLTTIFVFAVTANVDANVGSLHSTYIINDGGSNIIVTPPTENKTPVDDPVVVDVDENALELVANAKSAILIEPTTLTIIYQKNALEKRAPASMTKIMTMTLIMEAISKNILTLDQMLTASEYASSMGGTNIYLEPGEKMKVEDLLKSIAIASANDSAVVFAEAIAGSEANFVKMMNKKAKEIGATETVFKNSNGLPEVGHVTCARDMALMAAYLVNNYPDILKYTSIYEDYVRENSEDRFWLVNTNKLVKFVEGVDGLKTGWTVEAGYCLTATMKIENKRFIAVAMGCTDTKVRNSEIMQMLNYANSTYDLYPIYAKNSIIDSYEDVRFYPKTYNIRISQDVNILMKKGESLKEVKIEKTINYDNIGFDNKKIGTMKVYYGGAFIKEVDLVVEEEVKKASFFNILLEVFREVFLVS